MAGIYAKSFKFSGRHLKVGIAAKSRIAQLLSGGDVSDADDDRYYQKMEVYTETILTYMLANLPTDSHMLKLVRWTGPDKFLYSSFDQILQSAMR